MANLNSFPLVLAIKSGPSVQNELNLFQLAIEKTAGKASSAMEQAGRKADSAISFGRARGELKAFEREFQSMFDKLSRQGRVQNGFGLGGIDMGGLVRATSSQAAAEEALAAARRRQHTERMSQISAEADASLSVIQQRQAAETAAFRSAATEAERRIQLERQRVVDSAKMIAGPQNLQGIIINPAGTQQAATAARAYANAQREIAEAATVAARAVGTATAEDRAFATTARQAAAAAEVEAQRLEAVAATHSKVAGALVAAGGSLARTSAIAATSAGAQRAAYANLSNQIADVAVQAQLGTNAFVILLQQGSQASFALAQTGGKLAALGRFLSNPWVVAATTAAAVLGTYVTKLGEADTASHLAKVGANALTDAQGVLGNMFDLTSGKLEKQNELLRLNARLTAINLRADAAAKQASSAKVFGQDSLSNTTRLRAGASAYLPLGLGNVVGGDYFKARENQQALRQLEQERARAEQLKNTDARAKAIDAVLQKSEKLDFSGLKISGDEYRQALVDRATSGINTQIAKLIDQSLDSGTLAKGLRNPATKKTGSGAANRIAGMEESGRDIFDRINGIAAPFGDQPKLVQQTAKAMAELADITDDLTRKNDAYVKATGKALPGYEKTLSAAKEAAAVIGNAPVMAIKQQTDALADQARVQELLAQGRPAEAEALQAKLGIIRQIGVELDKEPAAVAKALQDYEQQRKRLAQLTVDAQATDATRQLEEANEVLRAELAGNERLADILARQFQIEQGKAKLSEPQLAALQKQVDANFELTRQKERQNQLIAIQVDQARAFQDAFTNFFENPLGKGSLKSLTDSITATRKRAIAQELSIRLFGDLGQSVEDRLRRGGDAVAAAGESLKGSATAITEGAANAQQSLQSAAGALTESATAIRNAATSFRASNDNLPSLGQLATTPTAFVGSGASSASVAEQAADIVVTGHRYKTSDATGLEPYLYDFAKDLRKIDVNLGRSGGSSVGSTIAGLVNGLGGMETLLSFASGAVGGKAGGVINGALGALTFNKLGSMAASSILKAGGGTFAAAGIGQLAGNAIGGIGSGMFASSIVKALGLKGSTTGGAIGGAIGNAILPGIGGFIGGALGSIVGGALKKTPYATSSFGTKDGQLVKGNNEGNKASASDASKTLRGSVVEGMNEILEQFGASISGDPGVSIGTYDGKYRVSTTGYKGKLDFAGSSANGLHNFGKDAEGAVKFAIQTMFEKGVISGIRESTKRLIAAGTDLDKQLQKALAFEDVFTQLKGYTDPVGAALDGVEKRFAGLHKIFDEAGASVEEYAKLEQLYGIKRSEAVEAATKDMFGTLQSFLDGLRFSSETGLSLRTREANARAAFNPLAAQIMGGQRVDQDKFTSTAQSYLDIARELYGSTQHYFDLLNQVTNLTSKAITNMGGTVTPITAASTATQIAAQTGATTAASGSAAVAGVAGITTTQGITGPTYDLVKQIANGNAALAQTIVDSFKEQTAAVAIPSDRLAWFKRSDMVSTIQEAMGIRTERQADGTTRVFAPDVVAAVGGVEKKLDTLNMLVAQSGDRAPFTNGVLVSNAAAPTRALTSPISGALRNA